MDVRPLDERGPLSDWDDATRLWVSYNEKDKLVGIEGNRAALNSLARHLLTLTRPEAVPGYNLSWEAESGWFETDEVGLHIMLAE
ncbi:hypothetical protein NOCA150004 [metagenome]|uniref:Uncharacterized protein n=1 Tax=metagenome TaxID=256318 RepID=A0A2P2CI70_9ZZZZ